MNYIIHIYLNIRLRNGCESKDSRKEKNILFYGKSRTELTASPDTENDKKMLDILIDDEFMEELCGTKKMEDAVNKVFRNDDGSYRDGCDPWLSLVGAMKGYEMSGKYECYAIYHFRKG